jgi:polyhydroxyalkanoate synthase subunit PhaC
MDRQDAERVAERAAEALGPEAGLVASLDPVSLAKAMAEVGAGLVRHPFGGALAGLRYAAGLATTGAVSAARLLGAENSPPIPPPARDRRFADTAWDGNPLFFGLQQGYLLTARLARELVAAAELPPHWHGKAELATQLLIDAMAPSNFLATNPAALKRAFDTGGRSAAKGLNNFLDDLVSNGGKPRQVDTTPFTLGENLAATKGKVVFRNSLMELLQYAPTTRTTYETPTATPSSPSATATPTRPCAG